MKTLVLMMTIAIAMMACGSLHSNICYALGHGASAHQCNCPNCDYVCKFNAETVDEDKECFDVESKVICIPRVVFPWQKKCNPCANNGAWTRTICVLKTEKYKCPKCEYTWSAEKRSKPLEVKDVPADAKTPPTASLTPGPEKGSAPLAPQPEPLASGKIDGNHDASGSLSLRELLRQ